MNNRRILILIIYLLGFGISIISAQGLMNKIDQKNPLLNKCKYFTFFDPNSDSLTLYSKLALDKYTNSSDFSFISLSEYFYGLSYLESDAFNFFKHLSNFKNTRNSDFKDEKSCYYHLALGEYHKLNINFSEALASLDSVIAISQSNTKFTMEEKSYFLAYAYSLVSSCNYSLGNFEGALSSALMSKKHAILSNDPLRLIRSFQNLSSVYGDLSSNEKKLGDSKSREEYNMLAEEYMNKSYELALEANIPRLLSISSYNLGVYYAINNNIKKADSLLNDALKAGEKIKFTDLLFNANLVKSDLKMELNQLDSAEYFAYKAKEISEITESKYHGIKTNYSLSNLYTEKKEYSRARKLALEGLRIAKENDFLKWTRMGYELLQLIEEKTGNYQKALEYYKNFNEVKDSLLSKNAIAEINEIKEKYETQLKENEIQFLKNQSELQKTELNRKNLIILALILIGLLVSWLIYLFYQKKAWKAELSEIDAKQKLLRSQLNPHFLFNVLNAIQQFIYLKEDPDKIADLVAKYSRLTRRILHHTQENFISLEEEILFLKDYMDLQQIRFDEPFNYLINVDSDVEPEDILIPPMFTQAFVENSIEHGILNKRDKGEIKISFSKEEDSLKVVLEDNGIGREKAAFQKKNKEHRSLATKLTYERLKLIEQKFKKKSNLLIHDITNNNQLVVGTKVILHIPYFSYDGF